MFWLSWIRDRLVKVFSWRLTSNWASIRFDRTIYCACMIKWAPGSKIQFLLPGDHFLIADARTIYWFKVDFKIKNSIFNPSVILSLLNTTRIFCGRFPEKAGPLIDNSSLELKSKILHIWSTLAMIGRILYPYGAVG